MRGFILLFLFFLSQIVMGQEPFLSFEHYLSKGKKVNQIFATSFPENQNFLVFIEDKKQVSVYNFDETGKEKTEGFSFPNFVKKYSNIAGYTHQGDTYTLFLSTFNKKKWAIVTLNFKNKSFDLQETKLEIKGDRILESLTYNDKHYLFTLKRDTSIFEVYILDEKGTITSQEFSFKDTDFSEGKRNVQNLDRLLQSTSTKGADIIDSESPIALESSKSRTKFYQEDALITCTIDASKNNTYYLQFDLEHTTSSHKVIPKATLEKNILSPKSNSFIFEDKLFILKASSEEMNFSIHDLDSMEKLTSFTAQKEVPIDFKNTPIIQEGGNLDSYRELEKTSKFLRKVASSNPAIAVFKEDNHYIITLGATQEIAQGGPTFFVYGGGLAGAAAGGFISGIANATYYQYNAYSYTKSAHFQMVLDASFQFVPDAEIPLNSFDNIKDFTQDTPETVKQTVFKVGDFYTWGAINAKNNKINFFKF